MESSLFRIYILHLPDKHNLTSVSHQISITTAATTSLSMTMTLTSVCTLVVTFQSTVFHLTKEVLETSLATLRAKTWMVLPIIRPQLPLSQNMRLRVNKGTIREVGRALKLRATSRQKAAAAQVLSKTWTTSMASSRLEMSRMLTTSSWSNHRLIRTTLQAK